MPHLLAFILLTTIAGLGDPFAPSPPAPPKNYSQSLQLQKGWNLVSWHIDLDPNGLWFPQYIPGVMQPLAWFHQSGQDERIYRYISSVDFYPEVSPPPPEWPWDYDQAYYMLMVDSEPWMYQDREQYPLAASGFVGVSPSDAWDDADEGQWQNPGDERFGEYWYFISYPVPGYTKLATIYTNPQNPNGNEREYRGPFHWLIWNANGTHRSTIPGQQYLTIVKTDDGKHYLPHLPGYVQREIDQIGVLEPGRGYFLGFYRIGTFDFDGWEEYPGWPDQAPPPAPPPLRGVASGSHFQYHKYTHWSYPVVIDTVAMEGVELAIGDEFGVFTAAGMCVGAQSYQGEFPVIITAWKDDKATPALVDGYDEGDEMVVKLYDASANQEIILDLGPETQAMEANAVVARHSGFGRGSFALRSLTQGPTAVIQLPLQYKLNQNFPNPFNAETVIPMELPQRSHVKLEIFNVKGQQLGVPFEHTYDAGWPKIRWNAAKLPSGIYFYQLTADGLESGGAFTHVDKMLVLK